MNNDQFRKPDQSPHESKKTHPDPREMPGVGKAHNGFVEAYNGAKEANSGVLEGVFRPVVADSHHFDEKESGSASQ